MEDFKFSYMLKGHNIPYAKFTNYSIVGGASVLFDIYLILNQLIIYILGLFLVIYKTSQILKL